MLPSWSPVPPHGPFFAFACFGLPTTLCPLSSRSLFLSLRVVMLPWTVVNMRRTHEEEWKGLGVLGRSSVLAISGLQWYWAYKIVQKFLLL